VKIVVDRDIPDVAEAFADCGEVVLLPGREISAQDLRDCRCLIVRSITRVGRELLAGSGVEFVGSATIGTDHIDLDYLAAAGIAFANAPGCNAEAVAEYVIAGLFELSRHRGFDPLRLRAGIVGHGNVGKRLKAGFDALGIECLLCDPPLAESGAGDQAYRALDTLLEECNLLSLHTPLVHGGRHPTHHLLDGDRLARLRDGAVLVNTSRGDVVDNSALVEIARRRDDLTLFIDTWEREPLVSLELLRRADLSTPHIAGYSVEGRLRGTQAVRDAAGRRFGWPAGWRMEHRLPPAIPLHLAPADSEPAFWQGLFRAFWDIRRDHEAFVASAEMEDAERTRHFDALRREYDGRFEYSAFTLSRAAAGERLESLRRLGFKLEDP
jgi:erythronate-4-phosphate dehydrogenase